MSNKKIDIVKVINIYNSKLNRLKRKTYGNNGIGAGGANTNKYGLKFEEKVNLDTEFNIIEEHQYHKIIQFNQSEKHYGTYKPDEWYINEDDKNIFILETKSQKGSGSVDEKLQTSPCKKWIYNKIFPDYNTVYTYTLSDRFKKDKYENDIEYLKYTDTKYFWGDDSDYKSKMVDYITTYSNNSESEPQ